MKNLIVVAVATGIFTGTSFEVNAQANINLEKLSRASKSASPKFINSIVITPEARQGDGEVINGQNVAPEKKPVTIPLKDELSVENIGNVAVIEKCSPLQFKYALLMDVEVETLTNFNLLTFIDEWWATRYRYGGTDKKGIDCSSFTGKLQQEVYNNSLPRTAREQYKVCEKVNSTNLQQGDLVFFNTRGGVSHVGVYIGNNHFVHSSTNSGVTISSLTEDYYSKRFISGGRVCAATVKK